MSSIQKDIYRKGRSFIAGLLGSTTNNVSDLNKKAAENTVNIMVLFSSNVPVKSQQKFTEAIAIKTKLTLQTVIDSFLGSNPETTVEILQAMLKNSQGNFLSPLSTVAGRLSEELAEQGIHPVSIQLGKGLSEAAVVVKPKSQGLLLESTGGNGNGNGGGDNNGNGNRKPCRVTLSDISNRNGRNVITDVSNTTGTSTDGKYFSSQSSFVFDISGINGDGNELKAKFAFTVKINAMTIESSELLNGMGEINNRDTFFQYLKMRAGKASFFKDVLLNLTALRNMAKRNSSSRLEDRLISELISGSNVLAPGFLRSVKEFKKFICVITMDDADILRSSYGLSITSSASLHRMFDSMSMLTLIVADVQDDSNIGVTMFDSDNPTRALSYRLKSGSDTENLLKKLFTGVVR